MGTTPRGYPYPEPTDPVAAGADNIKALAQALDADTGQLVYAQITASVSVAATTQAGAQVVINPNASPVYDTRPIIVEFCSYNVQPPNAASGQILFHLWADNTDMGILAQIINPNGVMGVPVSARRRLIPTAGPHNYHVRAWVTTAPGTVSANPSGPAYFRITRA